MGVLTLQVSSQQVEPGEQHNGRDRRHQQLQAPAAQQVHDGTAALRVGAGGGSGWARSLFRPLQHLICVEMDEESEPAGHINTPTVDSHNV